MRIPRVSILILNWNCGEETLTAISSVHEQAFPDYEIVVVDNASEDNSVELLRTVKNIKLIEADENFGFSRGVNFGLTSIDLSPDRMVLLLNNDAAMEPDSLARLVGAMGKDKGLGVVGGTVLNWSDNSVQFPGGGNVNWLTGSSQPINSKVPDFISGAFMLVRTEVIRELQGFTDAYFMYWEDVDFCLRARDAGWRLAVCKEAIVRHKAMISTGSQSPRYDYHFVRSATYFFWWGAGRRHVMPILSIVSKKLIKRLMKGPRFNLKIVLYGLRDGLRRRNPSV